MTYRKTMTEYKFNFDKHLEDLSAIEQHSKKSFINKMIGRFGLAPVHINKIIQIYLIFVKII